MKKVMIPFLVLFLAAASWARQTVTHDGSRANIRQESDPGPNSQKDITHAPTKSGGALLDLFISNLRDLSGPGQADSLEKRLAEMMLAARKAREANEIDGVFFLRYNRMLAVTKLVAVPDSTGILAPVIEDVLSNFVLDKLGHRGFREEGGKGPRAVNHVAAALGAEIIDLQIYLQTAKLRENLRANLDKAMSETGKK